MWRGLRRQRIRGLRRRPGRRRTERLVSSLFLPALFCVGEILSQPNPWRISARVGREGPSGTRGGRTPPKRKDLLEPSFAKAKPDPNQDAEDGRGDDGVAFAIRTSSGESGPVFQTSSAERAPTTTTNEPPPDRHPDGPSGRAGRPRVDGRAQPLSQDRGSVTSQPPSKRHTSRPGPDRSISRGPARPIRALAELFAPRASSL
jgi:hypothetical protein